MATKKAKPTDSYLLYGEGTEKLSQLSDIVSLSQETGSQPILIDGPNRSSQPGVDWQEPLPSQAILPTPELPVASQRFDTSGAREPERPRTRFAEEHEQQMLVLPQITESAPSLDAHERKRRVTRRGPMDEMRQLVRILVKIIPHSASNIKACEEGGGGNRISEDQIKSYLSSTLGDAPTPKWGVPEGWGAYLAELFTWVSGHPVSKEQAMRCAKREPGRSWEAIDSELARLRLLPSTWPLPLSQESLVSALVPTSQDPGSLHVVTTKPDSPKRSLETCSEPTTKRQKQDSNGRSKLHETDEVALWSEALHLINTAMSRAGDRSSALETQMAVAKLKAEIQALVQVPSVVPHPCSMPLFLASQAPHIVPISLAGPNGQFQTAYTLQLQSASSSNSLDTSGSLDIGGLNPSQFLMSQPGVGNSAFQAVKPGSPDKTSQQQRQSSQLLDAPPPLRLSQLPSLVDADRASDSPGTEDEDNSAVFNPSQLASPHSGPVSNLFKPTALKSDASLLERSGSQNEPRQVQASSPPHVEFHAPPPVLGYFSNGHFMPLSGGGGLHSLANPLQPVFQAQQPVAMMQAPMSFQAALANQAALDNARMQQANSWVPNMAASLQ